MFNPGSFFCKNVQNQKKLWIASKPNVYGLFGLFFDLSRCSISSTPSQFRWDAAHLQNGSVRSSLEIFPVVQKTSGNDVTIDKKNTHHYSEVVPALWLAWRYGIPFFPPRRKSWAKAWIQRKLSRKSRLKRWRKKRLTRRSRKWKRSVSDHDVVLVILCHRARNSGFFEVGLTFVSVSIHAGFKAFALKPVLFSGCYSQHRIFLLLSSSVPDRRKTDGRAGTEARTTWTSGLA